MTMVWPKPGLTVPRKSGGYYSHSGEDVVLTQFERKQIDSGDLLDHDPETDPPPRTNAPGEATDQLLDVSLLDTRSGLYDGAGVSCTDGTSWRWIEGDSTTPSSTVKGTTPYGRWHQTSSGGIGSGAIPTNLTAGLSGRAGVIDGELVHTAGYTADNDGGGDWFRFYEGVSSGANAFDKINCSNGQWQLIRYGMVATARSTTIRANGSSDDTAAFENVLARIAKQGACRDSEPGLPNNGPVLYLEPSDRVRLTDTWVYDPAIHCADLTIVGAETRSTSDFGTIIYWDRPGSADRPMFSISQRGFKMRGCFLSPNTNRALLTAIDWRNRPEAASTALELHDCNLRPFSGGGITELMYGVTTDVFKAGPNSNLEQASFFNCHFSGSQAGCLLQWGQPYNWSFYHCAWETQGSVTPRGRGIWVQENTGSCSLSLYAPNFGLLSVGIALDKSVSLTIAGGMDTERTKRLIGRGDGSLDGASHGEGHPISIFGGRVAAVSYGVAATNPTIAADEDTWIHAPYGNSLFSATGVAFSTSAVELPRWKIRAKDASLSFDSCLFPNTDPVTTGGVDDYQNVTYINCKGRRASPAPGTGYLYDTMHSTSGTRSRDVASVVIPHPHTAVRLPWGHVENFVPLVLPAVVEPASGSPSGGSLTATISSPTTRNCLVTLGAAAGVGASVRVSVHIRPRAPSYELIGENAFTSGSTVRATASSVGLRNFVWCAVLVQMNAVPTGNQAFANCYNSPNGFILYGNGNGTTGSAFCSRYSGSGNTNSPTIALSAADVGLTHLYVFTQGSGMLRSYKARAEVGSGNAHTPATAAAGTRHVIGVNNGGTEPVTTDWTVLAHAGSDTGAVPTLADVQAYFDAVALARNLVAFPGSITTQHLWYLDGGATVDDEVGTDDITLVSGTAPGTALVVPDLAWVT